MEGLKENSNSISFEIREETPSKGQRKSLTRLDNSFTRNSPLKLEDIDDKLTQAEERRKSNIKNIQESSKEHLKQIEEKSKIKAEQIEKEKLELLEKLQEDLVIKAQRRNQILLHKKESAQKVFEKIDDVKATQKSTSDEYAKRISEDMANKENNRKTIIQGVVQGCKQHAERVEQTRRRVSLNKSVEFENNEA